jgi:thioredoxin-like negative regulator of GroEL
LLARGSDELTCARRALQCSPEDYTVRYCLADSLAEQQQFTEAEEHLNWCLRQRPDDASLRRKIQEVVKSRIDSQRPIAESHQKPGPLR